MLVSGPAYTTEERTVEWLDRETSPFGQGRAQFVSLSLVGLSHPNLREVRISMIGGNVPRGEERPIDARARVLVDPTEYDGLLCPGTPTGPVTFYFVIDDRPYPFLVRVVRISSENRLDGLTFQLVGDQRCGDRPGGLAFWGGMSRVFSVEGTTDDEWGELTAGSE